MCGVTGRHEKLVLTPRHITVGAAKAKSGGGERIPCVPREALAMAMAAMAKLGPTPQALPPSQQGDPAS